MQDPDNIPWQLGLVCFILMVTVFGISMGSIFGNTTKGLIITYGAFAAIAAIGLTHDRIKYGRWFSR